MPKEINRVGIDQRTLSIFGLLIGLHMFFYLWAQPGFLASDDAHYARIAHSILQGEFQLNKSHFTNRFAVTVPTSLSYLLLGVNEYSTTLWPLLCSLLTAFTVFVAAFKAFGTTAALFSSFLFTTNIAQVKYSRYLLPDVVVSLFMFVAVTAILFARSKRVLRIPLVPAMAAATCFVFAILAKETAVWLLPFMIVLVAYDFVWARRCYGLWIYTFLVIGLLAVTYLGTYYWFTGEFLYRLKGIEQGHNVSKWAYLGESVASYVERLTYGPLLMILKDPGYVVVLILSLPLLINAFNPRLKLAGRTRFWAGYAITLLLSFWFGTTSLVYYNPLPLIDRMLMPIVAPLCILGGTTLATLYYGDPEEKGIRLRIATGFGLASAVAFVARVDLERQSVLYLGAAATFGGIYVTDRVRRFRMMPAPLYLRKALVVLFVVIVVAIPVVGIKYQVTGYSLPMTVEREIVERQLSEVNDVTVVFADPKSMRTLPFYFGFKLPTNIRLVELNELGTFKNIGGARLFVYVNEYRIRRYGDEIVNYQEYRSPSWKLIHGREGVYLFEIEKGDHRITK